MDRKQYEELRNALKIDVKVCREMEDTGVVARRMRAQRERVLQSVRDLPAVQMPKRRIGFFEFMFRQIPFMGRDLWMSQGSAALVVFGVLYLSLCGDLAYLSIRHIPLMLGILAIMLVMTSIPLLLRPYRYQMHEIELASRQSLRKLLSAELLLLTVEDLVVFGVSAGIATGIAGLSAVKAAMYFLLPLLLAGTGCVQLIRRTGGWEEISQRIGICEGYCGLLMMVLLIIYRTKPVVYGETGAWMICTVIVFPLFVLSVGTWLKDSTEVGERTDMVDA